MLSLTLWIFEVEGRGVASRAYTDGTVKKLPKCVVYSPALVVPLQLLAKMRLLKETACNVIVPLELLTTQRACSWESDAISTV